MKYALSLCVLVAMLLGVNAAVIAQDRHNGPARGGHAQQAQTSPARPLPAPPPPSASTNRAVPRETPHYAERGGRGPHYGPPVGRGGSYITPRYRPYPGYSYWQSPYWAFGWSVAPHIEYPVYPTIETPTGKLKWEITPDSTLILLDGHYYGVARDLRGKTIKFPVGDYTFTFCGNTGQKDVTIRVIEGQTIVVRFDLE